MTCTPYLLGFGPIAAANIPAGSFPQFYMCDAEIDWPASCCAASIAHCNSENSNWGAWTGNTWSKISPSVVAGAPTSRSMSLATAYQATDPTKMAAVLINITSTANFSLLGGTTNTADILIGATNGVATGTGSIVGKYANSSTGTIAVGLNMNTAAANPTVIILPANWYFAVRQTSGTVSITSAFDQSIG